MSTTLDPVFSSYLSRLGSLAFAQLPAERAKEVVDDITEHLDAARQEATSPDEARAVLERLGSPEEVVAAARQELGLAAPTGGPEVPIAPTDAPAPAVPTAPPGPRPPVGREVGALVALVAANLLAAVPVVGIACWVVGLVLLFRSPVWSVVQKWVAALSLGLMAPVMLVLRWALRDDAAQPVTSDDGLDLGPLVALSSSEVFWLVAMAWVLPVGLPALAWLLHTLDRHTAPWRQGTVGPSGAPRHDEAWALVLLLAGTFTVFLPPLALVLWLAGVFFLVRTGWGWGLRIAVLVSIGMMPGLLMVLGLNLSSNELCTADTSGATSCIQTGPDWSTWGIGLVALWVVGVLVTLVWVARDTRRRRASHP